MPTSAQSSSAQYRLILCTCPDQVTAQTIANALVDQRLAACVNILPGLTSVYQWKGKRETAQEHLLMAKTTHGAYLGLEQAIIKLHPYELPEVVAVPVVQGLDTYLRWIEQQTIEQELTTKPHE